jgi:hypothetical protein
MLLSLRAQNIYIKIYICSLLKLTNPNKVTLKNKTKILSKTFYFHDYLCNKLADEITWIIETKSGKNKLENKCVYI